MTQTPNPEAAATPSSVAATPDATEATTQAARVIAGGGLLDVAGYRAMGISAGIKRKRKDLSLIVSDHPATTTAIVATQNRFAAAPVILTREHVLDGHARAILTNSGNANAATGEQGANDARTMAQVCAAALGLHSSDIIVSSTGVIGRHLPMDIVIQGIKDVVGRLNEGKGGEVAQAMMTTDLVPKEVLVEVTTPDGPVRIAGVAKGSGMIHPNMATMLGWFVTDARVDPSSLQTALRASADATFNMISVDGDESTNDMVAMLANGASDIDVTTGESHVAFMAGLELAMGELARAIARDGEGATTLIEVRVEGALAVAEARHAARTIVSSSLVKSAIFGRDPNWGRILSALGQSRVGFDPTRVSVQLGSPKGRAWVVQDGEPCETLDRDGLHDLIDAPDVRILVRLGSGDADATAWGCDLSYDYVKINADYTNST